MGDESCAGWWSRRPNGSSREEIDRIKCAPRRGTPLDTMIRICPTVGAEPPDLRSRQARTRRSRREMDRPLGRDGVYRVRPHRGRAPACSRSTRRRRPSADRCTSATSSRTPTPTSSRASSACAARPCSIRWAGTTTACRPSGACRTTSASAAIRRCRTTRRSRRRRSRASSRSRSRARTSSSCAPG